METLKNAPLLEAIFEMRWGLGELDPSTPKLIEFTTSEIEGLPELIRLKLAQIGFSYVEELYPDNLPRFPYHIRSRYRHAEGEWPCYQLGMGIFTTNQLNEGYVWEKFKNDVIAGLNCFLSVSGDIPELRLSLTYLNGIQYEEGERLHEFMQKNTLIEVDMPTEFPGAPLFKDSLKFSEIDIRGLPEKPQDSFLTINLNSNATINGKPGVIIKYTIASGADFDVKQTGNFSTWLEEAHDVISPMFRSMFQQQYYKNWQ